jgi:uncharacterized protein with NRDE domain
MCLAVVALGIHPSYPLLVAANRDEYHARAAAPAHWWDDELLAGRDLTAGGTWFAVTRAGRWGLLTNVRDPPRHDPGAPTRGFLVPELVRAPTGVDAATRAIAAAGTHLNGFNLLAGERDRASWASNRSDDTMTVQGGVHALSNALLDVPWPKVTRTRAAIARWAGSGSASFDAVWAALADRAIAADDELPATGVSLEWERLLSAPFIVGPSYGTRCSTVFAIDRDGHACFTERSFDPSGAPTGEVTERFRLEAAATG